MICTVFMHIIIYVPNTVSGPSPERAPTRSAAVRAATRVENAGLPTAMSTIPSHSVGVEEGLGVAGVGGVGAPPTE